MDERVGVDELERGRERQHARRVAAERARGGQREHRPDALAAREQRVAHRLLEARGGGLAGEAQARRGSPRPARAGGRGTGGRRPPSSRARACSRAQRELARRAGAAVGRAHARGRAPRSPPPPGARTRRRARRRARARARRRAARPRRARAARRARRGAVSACAPPFSRTARRIAREDAVDEAGRLGAAERLGGLDGLVDRALGRDRAVALDRSGMQHLEQRGAQDRPLERRDPVERSSPRRGARCARRARPGCRPSRARARG